MVNRSVAVHIDIIYIFNKQNKKYIVAEAEPQKNHYI